MNNEFWENCCSLDFFDYLCTQIRKMKVVYGDGSEDTNKMKLVKNDKGEWKVSLGK